MGIFFATEDTVKALEQKLAKLEAKLGKKSESTYGWYKRQFTDHLARKPASHQTRELLCDVRRKLVGFNTEI